MDDISHAFGTVSQSYNVIRLEKTRHHGKPHAKCSGFGFNDDVDECDCQIIEYIDTYGKDGPSTGKDE